MSETTVATPGLQLTIRLGNGSSHDVHLSDQGERYVLGRDTHGDNSRIEVPIDDRYVSRRHCEIFRHPGESQWLLRDLLSSNGTRLNDESIADKAVVLTEGSRIMIGSTVATVSFESSPADALMPHGHTRSAESALALPDPHLEAGDATVSFDVLETVLQPAAPLTAPDQALAGVTRLTLRPGASAETVLAPDDGGLEAATTLDLRTVIDQRTVLDQRTVVDQRTAFDRPTVREGSGPAPGGLGGRRRLLVEEDGEAAAPSASPTLQRTVTERVITRDLDPALVPAPAGGSASPVDFRKMGLRGIALDIADAQLLDPQKILTLGKLARDRGRTLFRELALDGSIRFMDEIYRLAAKKLEIPLIENENQLMERAIEHRILPFPLASNLGAVLLAGGNDTVLPFATIDPFDLSINDWLRHSFGLPLQPHLVLPALFHTALQRLKTRQEDDDSASVLTVSLDTDTERQIETRIESVEVPQVVNYFLQKSHAEKSSDIHIEPTEDYLLVRNRVDGMLHELTTLPINLHPEIISRIKILSGMDVAEKRRPQDGRIATVIRDHPIDVRVSSYPTIYGEKVVMRLLDKNALQGSPSTLGLIDRDMRRLYEKLEAPFGLVMISGPTGSGKTTTLYSCLSYIDKKTKNVMTVEDPVEYRLKGVHQMQVNEKIGLTFASGLRTILRQDPDIIMVGECRDAETAAMAIQASLTGHIVFSTIHTNDAIGVITRMIDIGIDSFLVANALTLCIAQRLVRKVCKHCQTSVDGMTVLERLRDDGITDERLASLNIEIDPDLSYVVGAGCVHCRNTGYQGRRAVFEVFEVTHEARALIVSPDFNADNLRRLAQQNGMNTLIGHGLMLVDDGVTTHAEVLRVLGESY